MYKLLFYCNLEKKLKKQPPDVKKRLSNIFDSLEKDPYSMGHILEYLGGLLREVRVGNYRLYFSISEEKKLVEIAGFVYIIAYKHKDEQNKFLRQIRKEHINRIIEKCKQKFRNLVSLWL